MTPAEYDRVPERELLGRKVRSLTDLKNGYATIAAGTVLTITRKFGGLGLTTDKCQCCGVKVRITKVLPREVELLPEQEPRDDA